MRMLILVVAAVVLATTGTPVAPPAVQAAGIFAQSYTEAGSFPSTLNSGSEAAFGMSCPTPGSSGTCFAAVNRGLGGPFSVLQYDRVSGFAGNSWRGNIDFFSINCPTSNPCFGMVRDINNNFASGLVQMNRAAGTGENQLLTTTVGYSWSPTPYANGFFDLTSGATIFRSAGGSATDFDIALHKNGILHLLTTRASDTSITGATSVNLQGWGTGVGEGNAIAGVRLAAYQDFDAPSPGPVIFLTAAYDPADLSEVLLSAWNSVSGARVGSTRLVLPAGATANDKSLASMSYAGGYIWLTSGPNADTWHRFNLATLASCANQPASQPANTLPFNCSSPAPAGSTCTTSCASGFVLSDPAGLVATCAGGTWTIPATTPCVPAACLSAPTSAPSNAKLWNCWPSTPSGTACSTGCTPGFTGGYATQCLLGSWQAPTGSCSPIGACMAGCAPLTAPKPPNSLGWPSNCSSVPSLPGGTTCSAACTSGMTGGVTATCAGGSWSISGACADCSVQLSPPAQPLAAVCQGTSTLSASFAFQAANMQAAQFVASVNGTSCSPPPGLTGPQPAAVSVPVTCTSSTAFSPGLYSLSLTANVAAVSPCPATSTTPPATATVVVNPPRALAVIVQSINNPCPEEDIAAVFAFNITGLTAGAGTLVVNAAASSSAAGIVCTVLRITQTDDATAGKSSGQVHATCRGQAAAGTPVPVTVQLMATQGACNGMAASATATATVACCASSGGAAGAASVGTPGSSGCWQHGAVNTTCSSSTAPAVGPLSSSYVNRGAVASGALRAGLQAGCAAASALDVGVASTSCTAVRTMAFNVTVGAGSSVQLYFWAGCRPPTNMTAAGSGTCATWRHVPAPGPVSALQPSVVNNGAFTSYTWINSLAPTVTCDCASLLWAVSVSGTFKGLPAGGCGRAVPASARPVRARGRHGLL